MCVMELRVDRDELAGAVAWAARALPTRPPVPVLAGMLVEMDDRLRLSGYDYEVSAQSTIDIEAGDPGSALVPGRLLADVVRSLPPGQVDLTADGAHLTVRGDGTTFTLPLLPREDYPRPPLMPARTGTVAADRFAAAVAQVSTAAGRDDTLPMLTGTRIEVDGDTLTLACTDRFRIAVCHVAWHPETAHEPAAAVASARALADVFKPLVSSGRVGIALGDGVLGLQGSDRLATLRLLDNRFIDYRAHFPTDLAARAELSAETFLEALKRVALVAGHNSPVRLSFRQGRVTLETGTPDEARATAAIDCRLDGDDIDTAFSPRFLTDALTAIGQGTAHPDFAVGARRVVISDDAYRCVLMPVRLAG